MGDNEADEAIIMGIGIPIALSMCRHKNYALITLIQVGDNNEYVGIKVY